MKNIKRLFTNILFICLFVVIMLSYSYIDVKADTNKFAGQTLTIYNVEDYISTGEDDSVDVIAEFEELYGVKVNYYTYDTNETMYNQFTLQKEGTYDLICTSEYMIQKMIIQGLVQPMDDYATYIPNYEQYAAKSLREKLKNMKVEYKGKTVNLDEFAVGYMWGTLGILYDPFTTDTIRDDVKSWDILWDPTYKDLISLKNSMRDAYVPGLFHYYSKDESYQALKKEYLENPTLENMQAYNTKVQDIFDFKLDGSEASDKENYEKIAHVKEELISAKNNIFGFETDSGKNDMVTGKIKIDIAYSGDAVYSIDTAMDELEKVLEFYVPEDGANIWYDAWTLPNGANKELAYLFLDYLSSPEVASYNMDYIGYTPYIVGEELFDLTTNWYGASEYSSLYDYTEEEYAIYDGELFMCIKDTEAGILPTDSEYFESLEFDIETEYAEGDMLSYEGKIYNCVSDTQGTLPTNSDCFEEVEAYDLSYLFEGTLEEGRNAYIYPALGSSNELETQYPSEYTIARCAIMNDFGTYNDAVIIMWGQVKAYSNMLPVYIFLIVCVCASIAIACVYFIRKNKSAKNKRRIAKIKA